MYEWTYLSRFFLFALDFPALFSALLLSFSEFDRKFQEELRQFDFPSHQLSLASEGESKFLNKDFPAKISLERQLNSSVPAPRVVLQAR